MNLNDCFIRHGCDKSSKRHCYNKIYAPTFARLKNDPLHILEVGLYKGTSTRAFLDFFPRAQIYVIDDFSRVRPKDVKVLEEDRVFWLNCDSTDDNLPNKLLNAFGDIKFDIIIDDGMHKPWWNEKTFLNLWQFLLKGGTYFIEDVFPMDDIISNNEKFHPWVKKNEKDFTLERFYSMINVLKENSSEVTRYDLRDLSGLPDSVLFRIDKPMGG